METSSSVLDSLDRYVDYHREPLHIGLIGLVISWLETGKAEGSRVQEGLGIEV
jgi:hypothetical protein